MVAATNFAFLHGGGQGSWVWDDVIERLAQPVERQPQVSQRFGLGIFRPKHAGQRLAAVWAPSSRPHFKHQICQ